MIQLRTTTPAQAFAQFVRGGGAAVAVGWGDFLGRDEGVGVAFS